MHPHDTEINTPMIHEHTSDARTIAQVDEAAGAEGQALPTQGQCVSNPVDDCTVACCDFEQAISAGLLPASPNKRTLLTEEDAAAKEQLKQFRRRISQYGTSNGPTIDRYTASCRGWAKALSAASRAYYGRHVQDGALPQATFIRIAREIFEPRLQRFCGELLEILCDERFGSQIADRCDDVTSAINQLEQAWAPSSLISQQPQVVPAMKAAETAIKRLELFRPILLKQSPPMSLISVAVAESRYDVSRKTLYRAVDAGRLIDHRQPGHTTNALLLLCENQVAQYWVRRARTNQ